MQCDVSEHDFVVKSELIPSSARCRQVTFSMPQVSSTTKYTSLHGFVMRIKSNKATDSVLQSVSTDSLATVTVTALLSSTHTVGAPHQKGQAGLLPFISLSSLSARNWLWLKTTCHREVLIKNCLHQNYHKDLLKHTLLGSF